MTGKHHPRALPATHAPRHHHPSTQEDIVFCLPLPLCLTLFLCFLTTRIQRLGVLGPICHLLRQQGKSQNTHRQHGAGELDSHYWRLRTTLLGSSKVLVCFLRWVRCHHDRQEDHTSNSNVVVTSQWDPPTPVAPPGRRDPRGLTPHQSTS